MPTISSRNMGKSKSTDEAEALDVLLLDSFNDSGGRLHPNITGDEGLFHFFKNVCVNVFFTRDCTGEFFQNTPLRASKTPRQGFVFFSELKSRLKNDMR